MRKFLFSFQKLAEPRRATARLQRGDGVAGTLSGSDAGPISGGAGRTGAVRVGGGGLAGVACGGCDAVHDYAKLDRHLIVHFLHGPIKKRGCET